MANKLSKESKGVAHHSPGRIRLKVPKSQRHHMQKMKEHLQNTPGVTKVEVNQQTGSVVVHHEHEAPIFEILHKAVEAVGSDLLGTLIEGEAAVQVIGPASIIAAAVGVVATLLSRRSGGAAAESGSQFALPTLGGSSNDLKNLVPVAFFVAAAYKTYEMGSFWSGITPIALAYWGFDTYWKFNVTSINVPDSGNGHLKEQEPRQN